MVGVVDGVVRAGMVVDVDVGVVIEVDAGVVIAVKADAVDVCVVSVAAVGFVDV